MKVWIDADGCPRSVRNIVIKASLTRKVPVVFVSNAALTLPVSPDISAVRVDAVTTDEYILDSASGGDLTVTADIPLAAGLAHKGVASIHPQGDLFNAQSVGERLSMRNFLQGLRDAGIDTHDSSHYTRRGRHRFAAVFDRELTKRLPPGQP